MKIFCSNTLSAGVLTVFALVLSAPVLAQTDRFVAPGGNNGGNTCTSSGSPCATIGHALGQASGGDRIVLAAGIYTESLTIDRTIEIIGHGMNESIIQAAATADVASQRVITVASSSHRLTLRHLTVRHGYASATNQPGSNGGGIYLPGSDLELEHVALVANRCRSNGGAIYNGGGEVTMSFTDLRGNFATLVEGSFGRGGAIYSNDGSSLIAINSWFRGNTTAQGGAIYSFGADTTIDLTNVAVTGNLATNLGGGISNGSGALIATNSVFSANRAEGDGGGIRTGGPEPTIRNSVFWNNQDQTGTGTVRASISSTASSNPRISYSLVQGCGASGTAWNSDCGQDIGNNLAAQNPNFIEAITPASAPNSSGYFRQNTASPIIGKGNNAYIAGTNTDLDGLARIIDGVVDLGPYEFGNDTLFRDRFEP